MKDSTILNQVLSSLLPQHKSYQKQARQKEHIILRLRNDARNKLTYVIDGSTTPENYIR